MEALAAEYERKGTDAAKEALAADAVPGPKPELDACKCGHWKRSFAARCHVCARAGVGCREALPASSLKVAVAT